MKTMLGRPVLDEHQPAPELSEFPSVINVMGGEFLTLPAWSTVQRVGLYEVEVRERGGPSYIARFKV